MPTLTIRNLPEPVHAALRLKAAQDNLSVEAEVRKLLTEACTVEKKPATGLQDLVDQLYKGNKPDDVVDQLIRERRTEANSE
jgi:plasmid stability protein